MAEQLIKFSNKLEEAYEICKQINYGTYGTIYSVICKRTQKKYACKLMYVDENDKYCYNIYNELIASKLFKHEYIIKIIEADIFKDTESNKYIFYSIMEECEYSLFDYINKHNSSLTYDDKIELCLQIIEGVTYIHSQGYTHYDLSFTNIMIKINREGYRTIKIIDFGFMFKKTLPKLKFRNLTIYVQPPELITCTSDLCNIDKIDTWSIGQIIYFVFYGKILINYEPAEQYFKDIINKFGMPSVSILVKLDLLNKYEKLYNNTFYVELKGKLIFRHMDAKMITNCIYEYTDYKNCKYSWGQYSKINDFIKNICCWNPNKRPDMLNVDTLFKKQFIKIKDHKQNLVVAKSMVSNNNIYDALIKYYNIFNPTELLTSHLSTYNIVDRYDYINHTMDIMSKICCSDKKIYVDKLMLELESVNSINSNNLINILNSKFCTLSNIIKYVYSHHKNINDTKFELEFNLLQSINNNIFVNNAWELFKTKYLNSNKYIKEEIMFVHYLSLTNSKISAIDPENLLNAILILTLSSHDRKLCDYIIYQFKFVHQFINNSNQIDNQQSSIITDIVNADSLIIAFYIIQNIKLLDPDQIFEVYEKFLLDKNLLSHVDLLSQVC